MENHIEIKDKIRFSSKVERTDECWNWTAGLRGKTGYGCIKIKGKVYDTHRIAWIIHFGAIPKGMLVCHHCDNRRCVRPEHLFLGSYKDNMEDAVKKHRILSPPNKKYFTEEARHEANKKLWLAQWHKRGKYRRKIRRLLKKLEKIPR